MWHLADLNTHLLTGWSHRKLFQSWQSSIQNQEPATYKYTTTSDLNFWQWYQWSRGTNCCRQNCHSDRLGPKCLAGFREIESAPRADSSGESENCTKQGNFPCGYRGSRSTITAAPAIGLHYYTFDTIFERHILSVAPTQRHGVVESITWNIGSQSNALR